MNSLYYSIEQNIDKVSIKKFGRNKKVPKFMEGVQGVHPFFEQPKASQLQRKVQVMCGWKSKGFPGSQPVSMDMQNIIYLKQKPYRYLC